ncbi:hypothetical protein TrVE_jg9230 [Triparma verrucosa]|uniref:Uncharacterized protein n=1 Tax=Triparma verrucosa TaxID=1606542 RepID=A0A9W7ETQ3_9STRA|nr:hypothetical protein TrVE_jg9230 [Triparma verrucosa]
MSLSDFQSKLSKIRGEEKEGFDEDAHAPPAAATIYSADNTRVTWAAGTRIIPAMACSHCETLITATIPFGVHTISESAFDCCKQLLLVNIPPTVTSIERWAFVGCISLEMVTLPSSLKKLGSHAFQWCPSLRRCNVPRSITELGWGVFNSCHDLVPEELAHCVSAGENETSRVVKWLRWREADEKRVLILATLKDFQLCNEVPDNPTIRFMFLNEFATRLILTFL